MIKEAIILAGGLGTRLRGVVDDLPKSMAPVNGKPFLHYILKHLSSFGFTRIILATGYKGDIINEHFGNHLGKMELLYSREKEPLGTGGALLLASRMTINKSFFVINGDTLFEVDFGDIEKIYMQTGSKLTVALKPMYNFDRYGSVTVEGDRIISFNEKHFCSKGLINGGVYLLKREWLEEHSKTKIFSFEKDVMEIRAGKELITGYVSDSYFIDIGVPEDYLRASSDLHP